MKRSLAAASIAATRSAVAARSSARASPIRSSTMTLYVVIVPEVGCRVLSCIAGETSESPFLFGNIRWPMPEYRGSLFAEIARNSLAYVLPFAVGLLLYQGRRRRYLKEETAYDSFITVACLQSLFALFVGLTFNVVDVSLRNNHGAFLSLAEIKIWVDVLLPSLLPAIALGIWLLLMSKDSPIEAVAAGALIFSMGSFFACQIAYEVLAKPPYGYYWHNALLGLFMMSAFLLSWLVASSGELRLNLSEQRPLAYTYEG